MIDLNKALQIRRGWDVTLFTTESGDRNYPIVGVIHTPFGKKVYRWTASGRSTRLHDTPRITDLVNKAVEVVRYSTLSGDPEAGGVKLGLWRKKPPKLRPTDTGALKLTCLDGVPIAAEIISAA